MRFPGRATSYATILVLVLLTGGAAAGSIASAPAGSRAVASRPNYSHGSLSASPTPVSTSTIPPTPTTSTAGECSTTRLMLTDNGQPDTAGGSMKWDFALKNEGLTCTLPRMWLSGEAKSQSLEVGTATFNEPTSISAGATAHFVLVDGVLCGFLVPDPNCVKVSNVALQGLDHPVALGLTIGMLSVPGAKLGIQWETPTAR